MVGAYLQMNGAQEMVPNLSHDLNGHFQRQVSSQCLFSIVRYRLGFDVNTSILCKSLMPLL